SRASSGPVERAASVDFTHRVRFVARQALCGPATVEAVASSPRAGYARGVPDKTLTPPSPLESDLRSHWQLAPGVTFLNHGSFGAVPRAVAAAQDGWRRRVEAEPVEMLGRRWPALVAAAREPVAAFLGVAPSDLGFVSNATEGVNCVLRSLALSSDDELLTTTHVYHAVRQAMKFVCARSGATYREVDVPLPVGPADDVTRAVVAGLRPNTRLLVVDHVTSPTAVVFPVGAIADACAARGVDLLVDGAHAPGMLPLDLAALGRRGVTHYAGNLHKWCCGPKGAAFVWARDDRRAAVHPLVTSHWAGEGFEAEFHWQGTRDHSNWLAAGAALDFMGQWGGWDRVRGHNHRMAAWAHAMLCDRFGVEPLTPTDGSMLGSMATVRLPARLADLTDADQAALQQSLYTDHRIEVPLVAWGGGRFLRVSCQVYNEPAEYERLADVVLRLASR
ncbi:MAG: Aminotransferase, partial [Phycisphaerales bacterium]|nr:Aminotransferase [Phycisphaerales bacterium]